MKCPVCGKEAKVEFYYCSLCFVNVHTSCWQEHITTGHKIHEPRLQKGKKTIADVENIKQKQRSFRQLALTRREVAITKQDVGLTKPQRAVTKAENPKP